MGIEEALGRRRGLARMAAVAVAMSTPTWLFVPVADASVVPTLDLRAGQYAWQAGVLDLAYDTALSENLALGAYGSLTQFSTYFGTADNPISGACRLTQRLWGDSSTWGAIGLGLETGLSNRSPVPSSDYLANIGSFQGGWVSPSLVLQLRLIDKLILRGNPGIAWFMAFDRPASGLFGTLGLELAYRFDEHRELTLFGNGAIGYRWRY